MMSEELLLFLRHLQVSFLVIQIVLVPSARYNGDVVGVVLGDNSPGEENADPQLVVQPVHLLVQRQAVVGLARHVPTTGKVYHCLTNDITSVSKTS